MDGPNMSVTHYKPYLSEPLDYSSWDIFSKFWYKSSPKKQISFSTTQTPHAGKV